MGKASWDGIENLLLSYENCLSHGLAHLQAVAEALQASEIRRSRAGLAEVVFRTKALVEVVDDLTPRNCETHLREAYCALLSAFFDKRGAQSTRLVAPVIRENAASVRWLDGQIYQTRLQVWFMTILIPAFSVVFVCLRLDNFCSNVMSLQGAILLTTSILLFSFGAFWARKIIIDITREFSSSDLFLAGGRERLLRRIGLLQGQERSILRNLSTALEGQGDPKFLPYARIVRFGLLTEVCKENLFSQPDLQVHCWLQKGLILQRAKQRASWLQENQRKVWAEMKVSQARCAAKLNLRLIMLMGIFYLPAFFLILWICGTVVSFDNG